MWRSYDFFELLGLNFRDNHVVDVMNTNFKAADLAFVVFPILIASAFVAAKELQRLLHGVSSVEAFVVLVSGVANLQNKVNKVKVHR